MTLRKKTILFLSSGCWLGNIPVAPGTVGSVAGLPICWLLSRSPLSVSVSMTVLFIAFAIWIAGEAEQILGKKDPGAIVIDEMGGMIVSLMGLPFTIVNVGLGFALFRVLDITKPFPIGTIERRLKGGTGIVLDDIAAGIMVNITLRILLYIFNIIN
jgi:phosphatidylglycerophosphatase A